mmetsp:Transcript_26833/g.61272  ORF Transcript_26833/g.61272 Transcript_26833/m.61272 type:complete len:219 (-) Transcript_26833:134-790(-)
MCFSEGVMLVMHHILSTRTIFEIFSAGSNSDSSIERYPFPQHKSNIVKVSCSNSDPSTSFTTASMTGTASTISLMTCCFLNSRLHRGILLRNLSLHLQITPGAAAKTFGYSELRGWRCSSSEMYAANSSFVLQAPRCPSPPTTPDDTRDGARGDVSPPPSTPDRPPRPSRSSSCAAPSPSFGNVIRLKDGPQKEQDTTSNQKFFFYLRSTHSLRYFDR